MRNSQSLDAEFLLVEATLRPNGSKEVSTAYGTRPVADRQ
jgi:hypothetical protein